MGAKKIRGRAIFRFKSVIRMGSLLLLLSIAATNVNAQNTFKSSEQLQKKTEKSSVQLIEKVIIAKSTEVNSDNSTATETTIPYINYKGISDPETAKTEWINDNPEKYQRMLMPAEVVNTNQPQSTVEKIPAGTPANTNDDGSAPQNNK